MSTANVRKSSIFIPLDVLNSQHGCFITLFFLPIILFCLGFCKNIEDKHPQNSTVNHHSPWICGDGAATGATTHKVVIEKAPEGTHNEPSYP